MAAYAAHTTNYPSPNFSKNKNKIHTKGPTFRKRRFREQKIWRMGQKQKRIHRQIERATGLGRRTREEI